MSGLITGPNFQSFFQKPDAVELGTMVAVLEIGAFSKQSLFLDLCLCQYFLTGAGVCSNFYCGWSSRRYDRETIDSVLRCSHFHDRWRSSDFHARIRRDGRWENCQWIWRRLALVSSCLSIRFIGSSSNSCQNHCTHIPKRSITSQSCLLPPFQFSDTF